MPEYETDQPVETELRGDVAWIMLARPRYHNVQNQQMTYALDDALRRAAHDDAVKAIVLGGRGKHFCAGHDIGSPGRDVDLPRDDRRTMWYDHSQAGGAERQYVREQEAYLEMCRRWRDIPKPVVAMVQGACIAGGLMLAWVADLIVASEDAYFVDPVLQMGIPGVEYFAHAFEMHPRIAREFLYLGEKMPAGRAHELGMVNRVVPRDELETAVTAITARLAAMPRMGMALAKKAFNMTEDLTGKRAAMDAVFHVHHLAHAHGQLTTGDILGGVDTREIARSLKGKA